MLALSLDFVCGEGIIYHPIKHPLSFDSGCGAGGGFWYCIYHFLVLASFAQILLLLKELLQRYMEIGSRQSFFVSLSPLPSCSKYLRTAGRKE